jgi:hypothetical protein
MRRYLIVANQTLSGGALLAKVRELRDAGPCSFHILVPATPPHDHAYTDADAHRIARERLEMGIHRLHDLGVEATGEVGDEHPLYAIKDVLDREAFDEIIVSTLPPKLSKWLRADLPHRVAGFGLPVSHVEGRSEPVAHG